MKLKCPDCRKAFSWDAKDAWPRYCPMCRADINNDRDDDDIVMPSIARAREATKRTDQVYRDMERGSEIRAQMAADQLGVPVSEMSHLKVTNIRDNTREGEIAAMPVVNEVTRQMDMLKARGMPVGFGGQADTTSTATGAINVNGQIIQGIQPRAGIRAMEQIQGRFGR